MTARSIHEECRGAAMVFGIFFAVFLIAMIWYVLGLAQTLDYRQEIQDASDAAAFSAAVVNARGMNLIALINMTMAAILSVLVGLRLAQTVGYVAIGVCVGLAYPTMGTSLTPMPAITSAVTQIGKIATKVEDAMPRVLGALHTAGKAVSVVVPVGANLKVIDMVAHEYEVAHAGVAIPSRFTLPVQDDDFAVLCSHAGELSGAIAMLPFSPILPERIERELAGVSGKVASAGSEWFCGEDGEPPDLNRDDHTRYVEYPILPRQRRCLDLTEKAQGKAALTERQELELQQACREAVVERLASVPNRRGQCRAGEPPCPTDCENDTRMSCPPIGTENCSKEEAAGYNDLFRDLYGRQGVSCGAKKTDGRFDYQQASGFTPYEKRLIAAREQCDPTRPKHKRRRGYSWIERKVEFVYLFDAKRGWMQAPERTQYGEQVLVRHDGQDASKPCEQLVDASAYEGKELRVPVCQGSRSCQTDHYRNPLQPEGPCVQPSRPPLGAPVVMREQVTQITDMLGCVEEQDLERTAVEKMDVLESLEQNKKEDGPNNSPFRLEEGVWLGGSDFQLRAVVFGVELDGSAQDVMGLATWGHGAGTDSEASVSQAALAVAEGLGRIGLSQAEYYFDWTGLNPQPNDQRRHEDVTEWLWHMGWRARLRPFRLSQKQADGPRPEKSGPDSEQKALLPDSLPAPNELECAGKAGCEEAQQVIDIFGDGES